MARVSVIELTNPNKELDISKDDASPKEANEFLKLIKRSDYKVVDKLHQPPSKISILSLLLNSEAHKRALLIVLT